MEKVFAVLNKPGTRVVQTHISVVFIRDDVVYKVKKPVNFGFLDFSTLEKRKFYCHQEVKLNSRLCPEAYVGVEPVVWEGEVVDYAVVMKPLPMENSLKKLIQKGEAHEGHIRRVVEKIAHFHSEAETNPCIASFGTLEGFRKNTDENFLQTESFIGSTIDADTFNFIKTKTNEFYAKHGKLLDERAFSGKVRDCHGDLHTEHIVFAPWGVCIFDCIEFNERFRFIDTACDVAFLLMDMDYLGAQELSLLAQKLYLEFAADGEALSLFPLYKSYRAYVRGKVNSFMSVDENFPPDEREKKAEEAKRYFALARKYLEEAWW